MGFQGLWVKVSGFGILGCWGSYVDLIRVGFQSHSYSLLPLIL